MLVTFVIALREGLEGALIVGIVAAFLVQRGRRDLLKPLWIGVAAAALLCLAIGAGLEVYTAELPQKQQEGLETVVGLIAVAMVTYMVIWMRRNSRGLKKHLEGSARSAVETGSGMALVTMAFLAVFREGFETSVFLLSAFQRSKDKTAGVTGVLLGLAAAIVIGYGIYRGGIRLNLSKFFRATGLVLVLVAGGLVMSALYTAHEAGWVNFGQSATVDLSWLVKGGTVQWALFTGVLGLQPKPVLIEVLGWLAYVIPVGLCVAWPPGRTVPRRAVFTVGAAVTAVGAVVVAVALAALPARPSTSPSSTLTLLAASDTSTATVHAVNVSADRAVIEINAAGRPVRATLGHQSVRQVDSRSADIYTAQRIAVANPPGLPASLTPAQVLAGNGGRLPLGARVGTARTVAMSYSTVATVTVAVDAASGALLSAQVSHTTTSVAQLVSGPTVVKAETAPSLSTDPAATRAAVARVTSAEAVRERRAGLSELAAGAGILMVLSVLICLGFALILRRRAVSTESAMSVPRHSVVSVS